VSLVRTTLTDFYHQIVSVAEISNSLHILCEMSAENKASHKRMKTINKMKIAFDATETVKFVQMVSVEAT
jgi:hypothetical protein